MNLEVLWYVDLDPQFDGRLIMFGVGYIAKRDFFVVFVADKTKDPLDPIVLAGTPDEPSALLIIDCFENMVNGRMRPREVISRLEGEVDS